ncbi:MAG: thioredoxin [archaeon]
MASSKNGVEEITGNNIEERLERPLVVIDFFAEWCMPCLMMAPVIEELHEKLKEKVTFFKVNVDDNPEIAKKLKVASIPTLIIFNKGQEKERLIGSLSADVIEDKIIRFLE